MKSTIKSRIQLLIEIDGATYNQDWRLEDIINQSSREAQTKLRNILSKEGIAIIGTPLVKTVTTMQEPS